MPRLQRNEPAKHVVKRLGNPKGGAHLRGRGFNVLGAAANKAVANERAKELAATIAALKAQGVVSANAIAGALNELTARSVLNMASRL